MHFQEVNALLVQMRKKWFTMMLNMSGRKIYIQRFESGGAIF